MNKKATNLRRMTALSLLAALVAVLACLGNFVKIGPFPVTLTLTPIIIGAALYGASAGAVLGGVFGVVTMITGILGWDGGAFMMLVNASAFWAVAVCVLKGVAAGWVAGLVYRAVSVKQAGKPDTKPESLSAEPENASIKSACGGKGAEFSSCSEPEIASVKTAHDGKGKKNASGSKLAVILAGIVCPVTNTGIFLLAMLFIFRETLAVWAGGSDVLVYALTGLTGVNFLIEVTVNMILASAVTMIVQYAVKRK